jgi:hypothetical protein
MDAWSADQLKKMQAGGNGVLNDFFKQYGVDKYTEIREKYNNRVAEVGSTLMVWATFATVQLVPTVDHLAAVVFLSTCTERRCLAQTMFALPHPCSPGTASDC